jgi:hypothetical protein
MDRAAEAGMDGEQFWTLIEAAKAATGGDCRAQTAHLVAALGQRSVNEVLVWDRIHGELMAESYRWDLWGAASLINGGCGDDGFDYFRGWLLGQGRAIWQVALWCDTDHGISDSRFFLFRADGAVYQGPPRDQAEATRVEWVPLSSVHSLIEQRQLDDGASLAALLFLLALDTPVSPDGVDNRCGKGGQADGCSPADDATPS